MAAAMINTFIELLRETPPLLCEQRRTRTLLSDSKVVCRLLLKDFNHDYSNAAIVLFESGSEPDKNGVVFE
jgi:hypothetical protein